MAQEKEHEINSIPDGSESDIQRPDVWAELRHLRKIILGKKSQCVAASKILGQFLDHDSYDVVCESLFLLSAAMPVLKEKANSIVPTVFPKVVACLGSSNPEVVMGAICCLYASLISSECCERFVEFFIQHGLKNPSTNVSCGSMIFLCSSIHTFEESHITEFLEPLAEKFNQDPPSVFYHTSNTLRNVHRLLDRSFLISLMSINGRAYELYMNISNTSSLPALSFLDRTLIQGITSGNKLVRYNSVRKIRSLIRNSRVNFEELRSNLHDFFNFLYKLLKDTSTKLQLLSLNILAELVERIACEAVLHLHVILKALFEVLSHCKLIVKRQVIQILQRLMHHVHPMAVIAELMHFVHRSSFISAEIILQINLALLNFPLHCFETETLFQFITPFLKEFVANVRQAALECCVGLSYVSVAKGEKIEKIAENLLSLYNIDRNTTNIILERVEHRIFPPCNHGVDLTHFLQPNIQCPTDISVSEYSNGSSVTIAFKDDGLTSKKSSKRSIFTINNNDAGENCRSRNSSIISAIDSGDAKNPSEAGSTLLDYSKGFMNLSAHMVSKCPPKVQQLIRNLVGHQSRHSFKKKRPVLFTVIEGLDARIRNAKTSSGLDIIASNMKKTHQKIVQQVVSKSMEHDIKNSGLIKHLQSSQKHVTSTPGEGSKDLSGCLEGIEGELSSVTASFSDNDHIIVAGEEPAVSHDASLSSTPQEISTAKSLEQQSDAMDTEDSDGSNTLIDENIAIESDVDGGGDAQNVLSVQSIQNTYSFISGNGENGDCMPDITVTRLPPDCKNFNIFVMDRQNVINSEFVKEIFSTSDEDMLNGNSCDSDVIVEVTFPVSPTGLNENSEIHQLHRNTTTIITEVVNSEMYPSSEEFTTLGETHDRLDLDEKNYDADESIVELISDSTTRSCTHSSEFCELESQFVSTPEEHIHIQTQTIRKTYASKLKYVTKSRRNKKCREQEKSKKSGSTSSSKKHVAKHENVLKNVASITNVVELPSEQIEQNENGSSVFNKTHIIGVHSSSNSRHRIDVAGQVEKAKNQKAKRQGKNDCKVNGVKHCKGFPTSHDRKKTHVVQKQQDFRTVVEKLVSEGRNPGILLKNERKKIDKQNHDKDFIKGKNQSSAKNQSIRMNEGEMIEPKINSTLTRTNIANVIEFLNELMEGNENDVSTLSKTHIIDAQSSSNLKTNPRCQHQSAMSTTHIDHAEGGCKQQQQLSKKLRVERRACHQWIQNIHFLRRSQTCPWADKFEQEIVNQVPFGSGKHDSEEGINLDLEDLQEKETAKCQEGMLNIIRKARYCPQTLDEYLLNKIMITLIALMQSLKPAVAGQAVLTIGYLFMILKRPLESKVHMIVKDMLQKSGSRTYSGPHIVIMKSIFYLLEGINPQKAVALFIDEGAKHPNKAVREITAQFLTILVEKLGPETWTLSSNLSNRVLNTAANFVVDGSALTRHCGKVIFAVLIKHSNFETLKKKLLTHKDQLNIFKVLCKISNEGVKKELLPINVIWDDHVKESVINDIFLQ